MKFTLRITRLQLVGIVLARALTVTLAAETAAPAGPVPSAPAPVLETLARSLAQATVSIPWTELRTLVEKGAAPAPARPPVACLLGPLRYEATVVDRTARIVGTGEITLLTETWELVPIAAAGDGLLSATLDGQPSPLVLRDGVLQLLLHGPGKHRLEFHLEAPVVVEDGARSFRFALMPAPLADVLVRLPELRVDAQLDGALSLRSEDVEASTVVRGSYCGSSTATVRWRPRRTPAVDAPTRIDADTATLATVRDGLLLLSASIQLSLAGPPLAEIRLALPPATTPLSVSGPGLARWKAQLEEGRQLLVVTFDPPAEGHLALTLAAECELPEQGGDIAVPLPSVVGARRDRGSVGIEVRGGLEATPTASDAERIDVSELPAGLWGDSRAPLLHGFAYETPAARIALAITRHADLAVLLAMCDACEAATTVAPDGRTITKVMYIVRNNLKPFMTLRLPEGAHVWSAFVDDRPVTPVRNAAGDVLVPLVQSREVRPDDEDYDESYAARRNRRRSGDASQRAAVLESVSNELPDARPGDLKPYDVELVFVGPAVDLAGTAPLALSLPASDVPVGLLAWAIFVPEKIQLVPQGGNCQAVDRFDLPFQHFAEAQQELALAARNDLVVEQLDSAQEAQQALAALAAESTAQGVLPVRVELPASGRLLRFQKLLAVEAAPSLELRRAKKGWW